jgi:NAD:arginine ADP-ribosyltransferase/Leucine Rich repeat
MTTEDIFNEEETNETDRFWDDTQEPQQELQPIDDYLDTPLVSLEIAIDSIVEYCPDIYGYLITAMTKCQNPADGLSQNESAAIYLYTMHWEPQEQCLYHVLNEALRNQNGNDLGPWLPFLKLVVTALQRLPSQNGTIWRGVTLNLSDEYEVGKRVVWWSLSSCTQSIAILKSNLFFGSHGPRTLFSIECRDGKIIRPHSHFFHEDEVLLLPATQFEVKSKLKVETADFVIIHLKEVDCLLSRFESPSTTGTEQLQLQARENADRTRKHHRNDKLKRLICQCQANGSVNLNVQELTDDDIPMIVNRLINKKNPSVLQMCSNQLTDRGAQLLSKALQSNTSIKQLNMRENQISDTGTRWLAQALCMNSTLTSLNLVKNHINDEGGTCLARLLYVNTTLTKLYLANNAINHTSIQRFAQALVHNRALLVLDLSSNSITDDQIVYLAAMLQKNHTLRILGLADNVLTNAGIKFLMHALRINHGLQGLNIASSKFTFTCIRDIQTMFRHNETLEELWLTGQAFSVFGRLKFWSINRSLKNRRIRFVEERHNQSG